MVEALRPVTINIKYDSNYWTERGLAKGLHKGFFHTFFTYANEDGSDCMAIIELENGDVVTVSAEWIKFTDREIKE